MVIGWMVIPGVVVGEMTGTTSGCYSLYGEYGLKWQS